MTKAKSAKKDAVKNAPIAHGVGRRKSAVARVWLRKGNGKITVNGKDVNEYFTVAPAQKEAAASFVLAPTQSGLNVDVNIAGGGYTAQSTATRLGIARALVKFDADLKKMMRDNGFLTVDARVKERKKPGQKGARAKFQFTKR